MDKDELEKVLWEAGVKAIQIDKVVKSLIEAGYAAATPEKEDNQDELWDEFYDKIDDFGREYGEFGLPMGDAAIEIIKHLKAAYKLSKK